MVLHYLAVALYFISTDHYLCRARACAENKRQHVWRALKKENVLFSPFCSSTDQGNGVRERVYRVSEDFSAIVSSNTWDIANVQRKRALGCVTTHSGRFSESSSNLGQSFTELSNVQKGCFFVMFHRLKMIRDWCNIGKTSFLDHSLGVNPWIPVHILLHHPAGKEGMCSQSVCAGGRVLEGKSVSEGLK